MAIDLMATLASATQGVQASIELIKGVSAAREAAAVARVEVDLLYRLTEVVGHLAQAKDAQAALQDELREAKARIRRAKAFAAQRKRYALQSIGPQTYAYALKPEAAGDEPPHYCCPRCFEEGQRAILQKARDDHRTTWLKCLHCGAEFAIAREDAPAPEVFSVTGRRSALRIVHGRISLPSERRIEAVASGHWRAVSFDPAATRSDEHAVAFGLTKNPPSQAQRIQGVDPIHG